jgi:ribonuclease T2
MPGLGGAICFGPGAWSAGREELMQMPIRSGSRARKRIFAAAAALVACWVVAGDALAQRPSYRERPEAYSRGYDRGHQGRNYEPGVFDYYLLSLSWSPTYCADGGDQRGDPQCRPRRDRPYAFVLHGLWPQYERGWPQDCRSSDRGYVPGPVADRLLDILPSKRLVFHEYRTHGTCSGLGVDGYFDLARQLHDKVKIPSRFVGLTDTRMTISPEELMSEFMAANPGLKPDMIVVQCGGAGSRLLEVRIWFDSGGSFRACGRNENQARLCNAQRMYVPPVRHGSGDSRRERDDRPDSAPPDRKAPPLAPDILPGPRGERRS